MIKFNHDAFTQYSLVCCAIITVAGGPCDDERPAKAQRTAEWVENRIKEWQPTSEERAFDDIDWAPNLSEAESRAKKQSRAIFIFTYDGADLAGYRC